MKIEIYGFLIASIIFLSSCGYPGLPEQKFVKTPVAAQAPAAEQVAKPKEPVKRGYKGDKFRDPFVPLIGEGNYAVSTSDDIPVPSLGSLSLKGIFDDGKVKMAMISGGGINYILKGSRLYDNRQRLVSGISGIIKKESVIMIAPDKTTKELKLKNK